MSDIYNFLSFQVHGSAGGHAGDGVAGNVEALLTFIESLVGLSASEMFAVIMPGVSAMANIHPLVVHFPIALLVMFFMLDLVASILKKDNWRHVAGGMLYLGTIAAGLAVAAGLIAEETVEHGENVHLIIERHEFFGISILCLSVVLSIWRLLSGGAIKGVTNIAFLMFAALLTVFVMLGADLGGLMVYKYGVAVEAVELTTMDYFQEHTHSH